MSKAGVLIWRKIFETGDAKRIGEQRTEMPEFADLSDLKIDKDIAYKNDGERGHLLDIYSLKDVGDDAPVMINIHGGGLFASYKEVNAHFNYQWARRGYKVVSISYRRIPETTLWHQIDDVMAALRFINENSKGLGLDLNDCVLTGDSAGALLSLFALSINSSETIQSKFGIAGSGIKFKAAGFISIMLDTQRKDLMRSINDVVSCKADRGKDYEYYLLYPESMLSAADLPPILMVTSDEDLIQKDSLKLDVLLRDLGKEHELLNFPKGTDNKLVHVFSVCFPLYEESREVFEKMDAYFRAH